MKTFRIRLYAGFALAILLSAASGITSYVLLQRQDRQRIWVRQARNVIDTTTTIENLIINMESNKSGYRVTNQKEYLDPYYSDLKRLTLALKSLSQLVSDSEDRELAGLAADLNDQIFVLYNDWEGVGAGVYTRDLLAEVTENEKKKVDSIKTTIAELQKGENRLLAMRREEYDQLFHYATLFTSLESIISLVIILVLIFIIVVELNSRQRIQEQLHKSVDQLKLQTRVLQKSESDLKNAMDELGTINKQLEKFAYTVAHDIKSPLYGIIGALDMMKGEESVEKNAKLLKFVNLSSAAAVHLSNMVDFLLEYSKVSLSQNEPEPVDVNELLEQLKVLLFPPGNIAIRIQPDMPKLNTKKLRLTQVFQNLLSNAIKYNDKEKGEIQVGCTEKDGYLEFFVKDNGPGIPDGNREKIFSLLRTTTNKAANEPATGFGLNIAKLIVEEQDGKIWVESEPGQGAAFYFLWKK